MSSYGSRQTDHKEKHASQPRIVLATFKCNTTTSDSLRRPQCLVPHTEGIVNLIMAVVSWLYLRGNIQGSFGLFFGLVTLWVLETQCLVQIIANRVGLIMIDKRKDRVEKVLYLFIDGALNRYFLYLVRAKLISRGLTKYKPLFNFNAVIVCVSLSMDILIICIMSLLNTFIYVQFHPLAYVVKLNIELSMANLISKIVRSQDRVDNPDFEQPTYRAYIEPT